jgi:hypothetical protein
MSRALGIRDLPGQGAKIEENNYVSNGFFIITDFRASPSHQCLNK